MKVAVFGHYDSRGGTSAIKLPDNPTEADVRAAIGRYNLELFGIEEPGDEIQTTAYGMQARVADKMVHELMYPGTTPGVEDFLFVADLHGWEGDDQPGGVDLEDTGKVLIDGATEPNNVEKEEWYKEITRINEGKPHTEWHQTYRDMDATRPPDLTAGELIDMTLDRPVQLEYVKVPEDFDSDLKLLEKSLDARVAAEDIWVHGFNTSWTGEQRVIQKKFADEAAELEAEREARIKLMAFVVKGPGVEVRNWSDDAYGFILMRG